MKKYFLYSLFFALSMLSYDSTAQGHPRDSKADSLGKLEIRKMNDLAWKFRNSNPDTSIIISKQALKLSQQKNWKVEIGASEFNLADFYWQKGEYEPSMEHNTKALKIWDELAVSNDTLYIKFATKAKMKTIGNIGNIYNDQGNYIQALDYFFKALKMSEEMIKSSNTSLIKAGKNGVPLWLGNIGTVFFEQDDFPKAMEYFTQALKGAEEIQDTNEIARHLGNIGGVYTAQKNYKRALEYYGKALKMNERDNDIRGVAINLSNIGITYQYQGDYENALKYLLQSLKMKEELDDKGSIVIDLGNLGMLYLKTGKFKEAEVYLKKALDLSNSIGSLDDQQVANDNLSDLYDTTGRISLAFFHYKKYIAISDSINSLSNQKKQTQAEMNYEFGKKEIAKKAAQDKKDAIANEEKQKQKMIIYFVVGGLSVVLFLSLFLYRRFKFTQKQKQIIEHQKHLVEEQQQEILDSITYAKRLQEAILPPLEMIKKQLPESFVLYKPKSIVAGDFYWMECISQESLVDSRQSEVDLILIAAADCTGHGVPGAMVSVVCSNALNRTVKEFKLAEPGKILDKTRELVVETFVKNGEATKGEMGEEIKDGMDISLLGIDRKNKKVFWSGANNPLWYTHSPFEKEGGQRPGDFIMKEIKADKQPIGKTDHAKPFTTHEIEYKKDSVFYLFTDGYADQFGGPKGKKYKYKQLLELLAENNHLPLTKQAEIINNSFESWKGNLEQVDDVCVIGIKI